MGSSHSKLSGQRLEQLQKDTCFDKRELQHWYKEFMKGCENGTLNIEDFKKIYKDYFPQGDPSNYATHIFGVIDQNHDGLITFDEFVLALSITCRGSEKDKLDWAFLIYDINRDGKISYDEMLTTVRAIFQMVGEMVNLPESENTPEKRVENFFHSANKDETGYLDKEEFKEVCKKDASIINALHVYDGDI